MAQIIGNLIGALFIGFLIQGGLYKLLSRRLTPYLSVVVSGILFAALYIIIGAYGAADGGPPNFAWSISRGVPAAILVSALFAIGARGRSKQVSSPDSTDG